MKTLQQKLPIDSDSSFVGRTYRTPYFETPWHRHTEYEITFITEGYGTAFIGNYIGEYKTGEVYFLGKNLPHWFRKKNNQDIGSSIVIQFDEDFMGTQFINSPEMQKIKFLLSESEKGLQINGLLKERISKQLVIIEQNKGFNKLIRLLECLNELTTTLDNEIEVINSTEIEYPTKDNILINKVFEYSMLNYHRKIKIEEVALLTNKSISAFCHFFFKSTKRTYINFLTEIRISHACKLLTTTNKSITDICFESGFNNWANFSSHFKSICKITPTEYRLNYSIKING